MKKKTLALVLALTLVFGGVLGGTVAWLTDRTDPIVNTFTTSDISIKLTESDNPYKMVPGCPIAKDPKVTVAKNSEKCWLFVKLEKSDNFDTFMEYSIVTGVTEWKQGDGVNIPANVYYREVPTSTEDQTFNVLDGNKVLVKEEVTKTMLNNLTKETYPTLTVTAYAAQYNKNGTENFSAEEAWSNFKTTVTITEQS